MNTHSHLASLCLLLVASFSVVEVHSAESPTTGGGIVIDCAKPTLPSQQDVGEMTGQYNFSQVYATRSRLMAEARRACKRTGTAKVLVQQLPPMEDNTMAVRPPVR